jgi:hypothetical protein
VLTRGERTIKLRYVRSMSLARSGEELAAVDDPAWPSLRAAFELVGKRVRILPVETRRGLDVVFRLQVSARSALGALALNCGGLLIDHGWLRILGGGHDGLVDLAQANGRGEPSTASSPPGKLVVAYDVLGGEFAVDGGELGIAPGQVCYFAPDTLSWAGLGGGHGAFVAWACSAEMDRFYSHLRWPGWERDVSRLGLGDGLSVYPPLFTQEAANQSACTRRPVPLAELLTFHQDMLKQVSGVPDGSRLDFRAID